MLLKELPEKVNTNVAFKVDRVVYSLGNVTDPVTGLKCDKNSYWESVPGEWDKKIAENVPERTEGERNSQEGTAV